MFFTTPENGLLSVLMIGWSGEYHGKLFTCEEHLTLQKLLKEGLSFKKIAAQLNKDLSTISREVRKYAAEIAAGKPGYPFNACKNRFSCKIKPPALCGKGCTRKARSNTPCRLCRCNEDCQDFVEEVCKESLWTGCISRTNDASRLQNSIRRTKPAFRLQIWSPRFTNKHLTLQTGVSDYNSAYYIMFR